MSDPRTSPSSIDRAERIVRRAGALGALAGALAIAPGVVASAGRHGPSEGRPERVLRPGHLVAVTIGWFGAMAALWQPLPIRPSPTARVGLLVAGSTLLTVGLVLGLAGRIALGRSYRVSTTLGVALAPDARLVTSGPFALVRHPMYVGLSLAAVGASLLYRTWATLAMVAQIPVLVARARREDRLLERTFGDDWRGYARRVPAWLPTRRTDR
jgi:protein-S-isoprenylcysteine O-methyltransferase Ste14